MRFTSLALLSLILLFTACGDDSSKDSKLAQKGAKKSNQKLFAQVPSTHSGIDFSNDFSVETELQFFDYQYIFNGGGVAAGDINNDGLTDLFFAGNEVGNKLYLNKGGLKFEDITTSAGITAEDKWSVGVTMADVNGDGFLDIYVSCSGNREADERRNTLFINQGNLTFKEMAKDYGVDDPGYATQSGFLDYDLDGDLDLYVLNHGNNWIGENQYLKPEGPRPLHADKLYKNNGDGTFTESSVEAGLIFESVGGWGLGLAIGDVNDDRYPDIYISNDYDTPDYLYISQGDGTYKEEVKKWTRHVSLYSMGNDIADFNNDGWNDIYSLDMAAEDNERIKTQMSAMQPGKFYNLVNFGLIHQYMYNALQMNNGNGSFSDIAQMAGVHSTDWSWAPLIADFDNDGWKDLFVSNGYRIDDRDNDYRIQMSKQYGASETVAKEDALKRFQAAPSTPLPNYIYKNNGDLSFSKKSYEWGVGHKGFSQGAVFADLDNDGDLELVLNNLKEKAWLYENKSNEISESKFLRVNIKGPGLNTKGYGSKVMIRTNEGIQFQEVQPTRGYLSSVEAVVHFGIKAGVSVQALEVEFPDGKKVTVKNPELNQTMLVDYESARTLSKKIETRTLFADITDQLKPSYLHTENKYDDFEKEILLPHRNSQHGPGIAVGDANGDGLEDFYVGGAHQQSGKLYLQKKSGQFVQAGKQPWVREKDCEDLEALFFDADSDGDQDLYVVSGGNEFPENSYALQDRLYVNDGKGNFTLDPKALPTMLTSGGVVIEGDYDGDGDPDLFVGGRLVPGKYPYPARSYILRNDGGVFVDVTKDIASDVETIGLITDARWVDVDKDGRLDLLAVGEWTSINFYMNKEDGFKVLDNDLLANQIGWWYSIGVEDMDGDGDPDFFLGNLGLNYKYKASHEEPFHIYCDDFDNSGNLDIVLGYYNQGTCYPVRGRTCTSQQIPSIKKKFPTYKEFATASLEDVYGDKLNTALHYAATNFASVYLENKGNGQFEIQKLPIESQISSINAFVIRDFNGDGEKEVVYSGNLFTAEVETPRNDASIGGMLKRNKEGKFDFVSPSLTGYYTPGDVKDLELVKLATGKYAILVANNNDEFKMFEASI